MAIADGLLGPILGGVLGFLGAILAAIIAFLLPWPNRARRANEEGNDHYALELGHTLNHTGFHRRAAIHGVSPVHHGHQHLIEYWRALEVETAGIH
ncbi:hypothetical protein NUW58_g1906 [Xylaria curta]|uniref:Uncharacterized protein n=1 Tax=Xylaria curta TaxID=42375 RepID=A0ACC1PJI1_9PEZI|nr:hypothetical protein NUW58_g1906 [Xylaria curta]